MESTPSQLSIFSSAELPANRSALQGSALGWTTRAEIWPSRFVPFLAATAPAGSFGKTCPAFCPRTAEGILEPLSGQWSNAGMASFGECWTLNISEYPSDAVACSLSDILQTGDLPQKYYLTPKACAGILRRAAEREKTLPPILEQALTWAAQK